MSLFDGMASALNDTFGAGVVITPLAGGSPVSLKAMFRAEPVTLSGEHGQDILGVLPTLRVPATLAAMITTGDQVEPGNGKTYRIVNRLPSGSPATDAFQVFELEEIET